SPVDNNNLLASLIPSIIGVPPERAGERIPLRAMCDGFDSGTIHSHAVDGNKWRDSIRSKDDFFADDNWAYVQPSERQLLNVRAICVHHEKLCCRQLRRPGKQII